MRCCVGPGRTVVVRAPEPLAPPLASWICSTAAAHVWVVPGWRGGCGATAGSNRCHHRLMTHLRRFHAPETIRTGLGGLFVASTLTLACGTRLAHSRAHASAWPPPSTGYPPAHEVIQPSVGSRVVEHAAWLAKPRCLLQLAVAVVGSAASAASNGPTPWSIFVVNGPALCAPKMTPSKLVFFIEFV